MRILLVDDDLGVLSYEQIMAKRLGHDMLTAVNGIEGEALAMVECPDAIILDISMPVQDGWETLLNLRRSGYKGLIIMTSAGVKPETSRRAAILGADAYMPKPFTSTEFAATLQLARTGH